LPCRPDLRPKRAAAGGFPVIAEPAQTGCRNYFRSVGKLATTGTVMTIANRAFALLCLIFSLHAAVAHAETFHTCGTVIASLPTVISSQGVYCLTHDLSTAITSGDAIDIQTNNVTIDCNGYKLGGLAAGNGSNAIGIHADDTRLNLTVRNCGIRGFEWGISFEGGSGHLIEDNRLDNNLYISMYVYGENNMVRRNRVYDTGGYIAAASAVAMVVAADVIDNTISGVFAANTTTSLTGIEMQGPNTVASGNHVSGLAVTGAGTGIGIYAENTTMSVRDNDIAAATTTNGTGILGHGATDTICSGNHVFKFSTAINVCKDGGNNTSD
jgi:parallel beta-helix repeat protein